MSKALDVLSTAGGPPGIMEIVYHAGNPHLHANALTPFGDLRQDASQNTYSNL
jgi:hypothetical protein